MDCKDMTFLEAVKIERRMVGYGRKGVNDCTIGCDSCPLYYDNNSKNCLCRDIRRNYPEEYLRILADYDKAHPVKTILQDFREKYPNAVMDKDGVPEISCPQKLGYNCSCHCSGIIDSHVCGNPYCWNQPVEE